MKKKITLQALFVFAMLMSASFINNVSAQVTAPSLGTAASFAVLDGSTMTNTGASVLTGNWGGYPGLAITGFPPGTINGTSHAGDAVAAQAQSDATVAYNNLAGQACDFNLTGQDLGGRTLIAGVYCFSSSAQLTGTLTLNAQGNPNAVFIFKMGSTLTTASNSKVVMTNGGTGCNVFFQVGSSATLGTNTSFTGNILALTSITLNTGASINAGRALARNGAVTLDTNTINNSQCQSLAPTAAMVSVSGRVTSARGRRGISGALITMTDGTGVPRTTYTNSSGYYNFADVEVGQTLIFDVRAKRYNFIEPTKVVSLTEELTSLDFTAY